MDLEDRVLEPGRRARNLFPHSLSLRQVLEPAASPPPQVRPVLPERERERKARERTREGGERERGERQQVEGPSSERERERERNRNLLRGLEGVECRM